MPMLETIMPKFVRWNDLPKIVFDLLDVFFSELNARSGGRLQIDDKLSGIRAREKCNAQERIHGETEHAKLRPDRPSWPIGLSRAASAMRS